MTRNSDNRRRAFADVVTVDAWHQTFEGTKKVDLHADVVFGIARVGGESTSPVRFRLKVRRAEVVLVIPDSEPVGVDKPSVSRDSPDIRTRVKETIKKSSSSGAGAHFAADISTDKFDGTIGIAAKADTNVSTEQKIERSGDRPRMHVRQSLTPDGHYRWIIESSEGSHLDGRPWDPTHSPRLKLVDRRKESGKSIPPSVRIEVLCRREDLIIEDITLKDARLWNTTKARLGFSNRMAAAESYIRNCLLEEGLLVGDMADIFSLVTLASVMAENSD
jgi:hypothetical protein